MWTLRTARAFVAKLQPKLKAVGWFAAIGGGVLNRGTSDHDLDLILVPYDSNVQDLTAVRAVLQSMDGGWDQLADVERVQKYWREKGSLDRKHVEVWLDDRKRRIDLIVPSILT